jgi:26S proteasome regulatory subunit T4
MRNVYYFLKKYIKKDIIKLSSGPRYVVGAKPKLDRSKLVIGCRVAVD